jgi:ferredoxin--NADP+ reductase
MIGREINGKQVFRAYSIASTSYDDYLEFVSIVAPDGLFTPDLVKCEVGDQLLIKPKTTGSLCADYLYPKKNLIMLSTGTGIAPFLSIVRDPYTYERFENVWLFHTVPHFADFTHLDAMLSVQSELAAIQDDQVANFRYIESVTREPYHREGRFWDHLDTFFPQGLSEKTDGIMVCGSPELNTHCRKFFTDAGFLEGNQGELGDFLLERAFVD